MASPASLCVLTHGYCFDGIASAVVFARLCEHIEAKSLSASFRSCGYGPKLKTIPSNWLRGDINAILDFRYREDDRLDYYFDHHPTGFGSPEERARAEANVAASKGNRVLCFDPASASCVKLIASFAREQHGFADPLLEPLVSWADRVDSARFDDPEEAFFAKHFALAFAEVVERHGDTAFLNSYTPSLMREPLAEIAERADIVEKRRPLAQAKLDFLERLKDAGTLRGDIAVIDLGDNVVHPAGKFATYVAFPKARYSVTLMRTRDQLKLGVGWNPWSGLERGHDIADLCRREGGGGHAVVGAANFPHERIDDARAALARVVDALSR